MSELDYLKLNEGEGANAVDLKNPGKGKMLITCLDRSGSMYGKPFEALKHAAHEIGQAVLGPEIKPFEHFITIAYDNKIEEHRSQGSLN
jgi:uncharacterized protein with von Willebrand factor type A (vWA) domain